MQGLIKGIAYFIGVCILIGLIVSFIFSQLPVFPYASKGFLMGLSQGRTQETYDLFSTNFKSHNSYDAFVSFVRDYHLEEFESVTWVKTVVAEDKQSGYIIGIMVTKNKKRIPMQFNYIKEGGNGITDQGWRIDSIQVGDEILKRISAPTGTPS